MYEQFQQKASRNDKQRKVSYCGRPYGVFLIIVILYFSKFANAEQLACKDLSEETAIAAKLSNLSQLKKISCLSVDQSGFKKASLKILNQVSVPKRFGSEEKALKMIGMIPTDYPYGDCLFENIISSAAAFYTSFDKHIYLPNWFTSPRKLLVHEVVHALQDQHYKAADFGTSKFLFSDNIFANSALIEGQAVETEEEYTKAYHLDPEDEEVPATESVISNNKECKYPETLEQISTSYYDEGLHFTNAVIASGSPRGLADVFAKPPRFSAEILYPDRYKNNFYSTVNLSTLSKFLLLDGIKYLNQFEDSFGAYAITVLVDKVAKPQQKKLLAKNWFGDRFALYTAQSEAVLVWRVTWLSQEAAELFDELLVKLPKQSQLTIRKNGLSRIYWLR